MDLSRALFLDTETSGLAGGTGTFAFLIGVGFVEEDRFRVTQFLLRNPLGEAAMLEELAILAAGRRDLVTYNGGSFDLPLLETRFALNGVRSPFRDARHLDLLHPARRLFKPRHENARLSTLERELLEVERDDDIPGDRIPQVFFDFLRHGHHPSMESVLAHNRYDIVTLAALALRALERMDEDWFSDDPADLHGAGHHFWRRGESEVAIPLLERALSAGPLRPEPRPLPARPRRAAQAARRLVRRDRVLAPGQHLRFPGAARRAGLVRQARGAPAEGTGPRPHPRRGRAGTASPDRNGPGNEPPLPEGARTARGPAAEESRLIG